MQRYLTKSKFKTAFECPSKLFYVDKKKIYYDKKLDDDFLISLAKGGFQVGELAKLYYPGGTTIEELDHDTALQKTLLLIKKENVIIYEAAFSIDNLFIRADIIIKAGKNLKLIEVKAKSHDSKEGFTTKGGAISSKWEPYLYDVAFQKFVIKKSFPDLKIQSYLLLADKNKCATVDGLNQMFFIYEENGRYKVNLQLPDPLLLGEKILTEFNVDNEIEIIFKTKHPMTFNELISLYSETYSKDQKMSPIIGSQCGKCEFIADESLQQKGFKSGFHECWKQSGVSDKQLEQPLILSLWDFRKKDEFIKHGKYLLIDIKREDLEPKSKSKTQFEPGLSRIDRQELQIKKVSESDDSPYIDINGLKKEMSNWIYPLHFIDFETTIVAIPFHMKRRPYEQVAFQFSHHTVSKDGKIKHEGQWISTAPGKFPNYDFVRALKKQLSLDNGTIFRYAAHENTVLNVILQQLSESNETDKNELIEWIKTITRSTSSSSDQWEGKRNMIDLRELVLKYYYNPLTNGSNSIKYVFPSVLKTSKFLQTKYSIPIYGSQIESLNFKDQIWVNFRNGNLINPYDLLPAINQEASNEMLDEYLIDEEAGIADGGAAMIAFAKMQFTQMKESERQNIVNALLRYCELDTLAMVMIYEDWKESCK